jgi:hypothetical protein
MRISKKSVIAVAAVCLLFGLLSLCLTPADSPLTEDAFITFRYVANLLDGNGLVFNKSERVEAISNFSWTLLLPFLSKLGLPLLPTALGVGLGFGVLTIIVIWAFGVVALETKGYFQFIAPALLATHTFWVVWCERGLETGLYGSLITAGTLCLARELKEETVYPWSALAFSLGAMTRPEGSLLFLGVVTIVIGRDAMNRRLSLHTVATVLTFCVVYGAFVSFRIYYYNDILPNSVFFKAALVPKYRKVLSALFGFVVDSKAYLIFLPMLFAFSGRRGNRPFVSAAVIITGFYALTVLFVNEPRRITRYLAPMLPLCFLLVQEGVVGIARVARNVTGGKKRYKEGIIGALALSIVLTNFFWNSGDYYWPGYGVRANLMTGSLKECLSRPSIVKKKFDAWCNWGDPPQNFQALFGDWIRRNIPENSVIVYDQMGQTPFYAGLSYTFIDSSGLTDRTIARLQHGQRNALLFQIRELLLGMLPGVKNKGPYSNATFSEYIYSRSPDYIFMLAESDQLKDLVSHDAFARRYERFLLDSTVWPRASYKKRGVASGLERGR